MAKRTTPPPGFLQRIASIFDKVEPIPIIIFVFLIFGAFHQVYSLYKIGYPYIRFFSATQLLSDSISFLLILVIKIIYPFILGGCVALLVYRIFNAKKIFVYKYSVYIIYVLFTIYIIFWNNNNTTEHISFIILFVYGYQLSCNVYGLLYVYRGEENETSKANNSISLIPYFFVVFTLYMFVYTPLSKGYSLFISNTILNSEFENFDKIHKIYKSKGVRDRILYFNDNYIFVEIKKDSVYPDKKNPKKLWKKPIRKIEILKFDKFFE